MCREQPVKVVTAADLNTKRSVHALQRVFREAPAPELGALVGSHEAKFAGRLRLGGPFGMRVTGMPGWWGKQFRVPAAGGEALEGENLLRRRGRLVESPDARWPHRPI